MLLSDGQRLVWRIPQLHSDCVVWQSTEVQPIPGRNPPVSFRCSSMGQALPPWALSLLQLTSRLCLQELPETFELTAASLAWITLLPFSVCHTAQGTCPKVAALYLARPHPWTVILSSDPQASSRHPSVAAPVHPWVSCFLFKPALSSSVLFSLLEEGSRGKMSKATSWVYLHSPGDLCCLWT